MDSQSPQSDSLTLLSQPLVISQDQMRLTDCWKQQKPRKKQKLDKSMFEQRASENAEGAGLQCLALSKAHVSKEPRGEDDSANISKSPLALEGVHSEASGDPPLVDPDELWEAELLQMDLDRSFYTREGRPWKVVPKPATWHSSADLEGLSKEELEEKLGSNASGWVHHSVNLDKEGGKFVVHQEDCVKVRAEGEREDTAIVYVDAIISIEERDGSGASEVTLSSDNRTYFVRGWRLITMEETLLKPPEESAPVTPKAEWPPQERYLAIHSLSLWPVELVTSKVQVHWGIQAPHLEGRGLLLEGAVTSSFRAQAAAKADEIYCPMMYCSETHDFVGLDKSPEVESKTVVVQRPAEPQMQEALTPRRPLLPGSPCRVADSSPSMQQTPPDLETNTSQPWEPLRLTYDVQTASQDPSSAAPFQAPSPIVLINASALSPHKKPPPLPFSLRCQALSLQNTPSRKHAPPQSVKCAPASLQPFSKTSSTEPFQLPAPPVQSTPDVPEEVAKLLEFAPGSQPGSQVQSSNDVRESLQLQGAPTATEGDKRVLQTLDLCAGTGAFSLGCSYASLGEQGEYKIVPKFAVDIKKDQLSTCEQNIPGIQVFRQSMDEFYNEIVSSNDPALPGPHNVDLITVGLPCQTFSGANPRNNNTSLRKSSSDAAKGACEEPKRELLEGLPKKLPEGRLFFQDFLRIVEYVQPRFILLEEVVEILTLLDERLHEPVAIAVTRDLVRLGYQTRWQVLLAAQFGAPQNRFRAFLCAARLGEKLPQVAIPTHRGSLGRPSKNLGCFEHCLLLLEEKPSGTETEQSGMQKQKTKRTVKKKKPLLGLRIELRTTGDGETAGKTAGLTAKNESVAETSLQVGQAVEIGVSVAQLATKSKVPLAVENVITEDEINGGGVVARVFEETGADQERPARVAVNALAALMKPSGVLKRKLADEATVAPNLAAFFRSKEGYALVNKRRPDLAGNEGDRKRRDCSCCLQRQRAGQTADLLPAVTVHQAIGHLPEVAAHSKLPRRDGSILYNHVVQGVKPGKSKRYAQYQLLKPGQRDEDLPPGLRSPCASGRQPAKAKGGVKERMPRDGQANTVVCTVNVTNTKCYHYAHNRLTSPREQALLQTFPENYRLRAGGSLPRQIESWHEQVGNAVPMVVAAALGRAVLSSLN